MSNCSNIKMYAGGANCPYSRCCADDGTVHSQQLSITRILRHQPQFPTTDHPCRLGLLTGRPHVNQIGRSTGWIALSRAVVCRASYIYKNGKLLPAQQGAQSSEMRTVKLAPVAGNKSLKLLRIASQVAAQRVLRSLAVDQLLHAFQVVLAPLCFKR